ncbi:MAG TPA: choice-of-anchor Q domain-containing protein [Rhodanobacteraceae bacterium]|nr:choice-of-anchor Q domain-containing protein [Rhodanobacteraceae bacterium]
MNGDRLSSPFRIRPLAGCLAIVLGIGGSAAFGQTAAATHARATSGFRDALRTALPAHRGRAKKAAPASRRGSAIDSPACTETWLRDALTNALTGDTVTIPLDCSRISLTAGAIPIAADDLDFVGPGADAFTLDGGAPYGFHDRVLTHLGSGTLTISGMTIANASVADDATPNGGCISSSGTVDLVDSVVTNCSLHTANASAFGGAIYAQTVNLHSSTVTANTVQSETNLSFGGGIFSLNGLDIEGSTISDNIALASPVSFSEAGGASSANGAVKIIDSTLSGNEAMHFAGLLVSYGTSVEITNSTISGNTASVDIGGAALYAPATISNSTIAFNASGPGDIAPGILAGGPLTAQSSIFANNTTSSGDEIDVYAVSGPIVGEKNLIVSTSSQPPADTKTACPRLGPLADNGGPTKTHALLPGSPAIDNGENPLNLQFDQRQAGFQRTYGDSKFKTDIGAYEWQGDAGDEIFLSRFETACD